MLERILARLGPPIDAIAVDAFRVLPIPRYAKHYFGHSATGRPCLLLHSRAAGSSLRPPLRLQGLDVTYDRACRLSLPDGSERTDRLTTLNCISTNDEERTLFLRTAELLLGILGPDPEMDAVVTAVERLTRLFQRLAEPPKRSITGLIGELMLILLSASPRATMLAWRSSTDDRFDFAIGEVRLEVKAAQNRARTHYLSYEQCHPPEGVEGLLVSMFVESAGGGTSIAELIAAIEARLKGHDDAVLRLHEVVADTLGRTLATGLLERFDEALARQSLRTYALADIPAVRGILPRGVSQVRFQSDLGLVTPLRRAQLQALSRQARQLLPAAAN